MPLLVAVQVYQFPVTLRIRSAQASRSFVVAVQFLTFEEEVPTAHRTAPVLAVGQLHVTGGQGSAR